ncbi:VanZ family protein [Thermodesulfitimonas autotrophica]|uniref:VanZ family protein n=1 Tax=Thermodesulfitimonas autotrophica TaxID=1894989 RepID=UPI002FE23598
MGSKKDLVAWWLAVLLMAALIAHFSNQPFADQDLRPELSRRAWLMQRVRTLPAARFSYDGQQVDSRRDPAGFVQFWVRKGAHVFFYSLLGLLLAQALAASGLRGGARWLGAAGLLLVVAAGDEHHQLAVPGRTGRLLDVLIDLAGFGLLAGIAWLRERHFRFRS